MFFTVTTGAKLATAATYLSCGIAIASTGLDYLNQNGPGICAILAMITFVINTIFQYLVFRAKLTRPVIQYHEARK